MKNLKYILIINFLLVYSFSKSQFNTLRPQIKEKIEKTEKENTTEKNTKNDLKESKKTILNTLFKTNNSKADLKKDIDSLKSLLKEYNQKSQTSNLKYKRISDSLIEYTKKIAIQNESETIHENIKQYRFIDEPKEEMVMSNNNNRYANNKINYFNKTKEIKKIAMPLSTNLKISSNFGMRKHPIYDSYKFHNGVDLSANYQDVFSVLDGVVVESGWDNGGGGNFIAIKHSNRFTTLYLHLSEIYYKVGDIVKAGYIIARSGNTGTSTAPHLHFAVKENDNYINPVKFLNTLINYNNLIANYYGK